MSLEDARKQLGDGISLLNSCYKLLSRVIDAERDAGGMVISEISTGRVVEGVDVLLEESDYDKEMLSKHEWHAKFVKISELAVKTKGGERLLYLNRLKTMICDAISVMESNKNE